jgi:beta-xylosidase
MFKLHYIRIMILSVFLVLTFSCTSGCVKHDDPDPVITPVAKYDTVRTYTNPLGGITNIGDPYILKYDSAYYLYATSSATGFKVWQSSNMIDWSDKGLALNRDNAANLWGSGNFWAPEVKFYDGKFYMTYSAIGNNGKMKIRIARSDSPLGPFINYSEPFLNGDNFSYIDADLFFDEGKIYMYYVKDCSENIINGKHTSQIFVVQLDNTLKDFEGSPVLALQPDQTWENPNSDWSWNEGPFIMKHENLFYLTYSANVYSSIDYAVGYATAVSLMGPWTKYPGNPILQKDVNLRVSGPGHNCITSSPDDKELFIVYHTHTFYDNPSGDRNLCIDRLVFDNGVMKVVGPTRTPQPLPSGILYRLIPKN